MSIDKDVSPRTRQDVIREVQAKLSSGQCLDEAYVSGYLHLARDGVLMMLALKTLREEIPDKADIRAFNALQNAVERYEIVNKDKVIGAGAVAWSGIFTDQDGNPVEVQYQETKGDA